MCMEKRGMAGGAWRGHLQELRGLQVQICYSTSWGVSEVL